MEKLKLVKVSVNKIWSYQTLVSQTRYGRYRKKEYLSYIAEMTPQLHKLPSIEHKRDLVVSIHFNCKNRTVGDLDNITKPILDTLQSANKIYDDRYITSLVLSKSFGHKENSIEIEIKEKGE